MRSPLFGVTLLMTLSLATTSAARQLTEGFNALGQAKSFADPTIRLLEESDREMLVEWRLSGFNASTVSKEPEGDFIRLSINDLPAATRSAAGAPELPLLNQPIRLPRGAGGIASVIEAEWVEFESVRLFPRQFPTRDGDDRPRPFAYDPEAYSLDKAIPIDLAGVTRPSGWMGETVAGLWVSPFRYNAAAGRLEAATRLLIRVEFIPGGSAAPVTPETSRPNAEKLLRNKLLNPPPMNDGRDEPDEQEPYRLLVVLREEALETTLPLIQLHHSTGLRTRVWTIDGDVSADEIKSEIRDMYEDGLEYVLLIGDGNEDNVIVPMIFWDDVDPNPQIPEEDRFPRGSGSDAWYACLDPVDGDGFDDHFPDVAVGRLVYDNVNQLAQLRNQVAKLVGYIGWQFENQDGAWLNEALLIAHKEFNQDLGGRHYQNCKETIRNADYRFPTPDFVTAYGSVAGVNNDLVLQELAEGKGFVNYRGHGDETRWASWNNTGQNFNAAWVAQINNPGKPFIFVSSACENGDIYDFPGTCLLESFQKADDCALSSHGAVITSFTNGNTFFDIQLFDAFFNEGITSIGFAAVDAEVELVQHFDADGYPGEGRTNLRTYLWLGDPALQYRLGQPQQLTITAPDTIPVGSRRLSLNTLNRDGLGYPGATVVLRSRDGDDFYALTRSDARGEASFEFDEPIPGPATYIITVSARNGIPASTEIVVASGIGVVRGRVARLDDDSPLEGARLDLSIFDIEAFADARGEYSMEGIPGGQYRLTASYAGRIASSRDVVVVEGDTSVVDFALAFSRAAVDTGLIYRELRDGEQSQVQIEIANPGNGVLEWTSRIEFSSEHAPYDSLTDYWPSLEVDDSRLNGVVYADGLFYIAGGNNNQDPNFIYVFDREGRELRDQRLEQPRGVAGNGFYDLAFDGEFLYGASGDAIWVMTLAGEVVDTIPSPFNPGMALAVNPAGELWVANHRTTLVRIDRDGRTLQSIQNSDYVKGLAYVNDPAGFNLLVYALQGQAGGVMVYQRNPITGAMGDYHYPSNSPSESAIAGVEATLAYDPTQWTLMGMLADGEVRILRLWHLAPRTGWVTVTPLEGSTPPEDADVITVGFDARDLPEEATLNAGLIIESNGEEPRVTIPLRMAANPNSVPGETGEVFPTTLAIRSATPNPFNGRTMIAIDVPRSSRLKLSVYDLAGRLVRTIHDGEVGAGQATFSLTMDAAPSGVYLLSAITLGGSDLHKIVLVR